MQSTSINYCLLPYIVFNRHFKKHFLLISASYKLNLKQFTSGMQANGEWGEKTPNTTNVLYKDNDCNQIQYI